MSQVMAGPIKAIHIQVPVGIPTPDGGLEIPNRVFLGGIPAETTELELELFFSDYGVVKDVRIVTDRVTGECKGYGFVTFDEAQDISSLVRRKSIMMKGKKLRVRKAIRRNGSQFQADASPVLSGSSPSRSPTSETYWLVPVDGHHQNMQQQPPYGYVPQPAPHASPVTPVPPPTMMCAPNSGFGQQFYFAAVPNWPIFQV